MPFQDNSVFDLAPGALIGLNVGLAAGLLGAYLPDQSRYGPSWKRVLLVDLGGGRGRARGRRRRCVALVDDCLTGPDAARRRARDRGVGRRSRAAALGAAGRHPAHPRHRRRTPRRAGRRAPPCRSRRSRRCATATGGTAPGVRGDGILLGLEFARWPDRCVTCSSSTRSGRRSGGSAARWPRCGPDDLGAVVIAELVRRAGRRSRRHRRRAASAARTRRARTTATSRA